LVLLFLADIRYAYRGHGDLGSSWGCVQWTSDESREPNHCAVTWPTWNSQEHQWNVLYVLENQRFACAAQGERFSNYIAGDWRSLWRIDSRGYSRIPNATDQLRQGYQTSARQGECRQPCHLAQYLNTSLVQYAVPVL
jgi:hypothetical protein